MAPFEALNGGVFCPGLMQSPRQKHGRFIVIGKVNWVVNTGVFLGGDWWGGPSFVMLAAIYGHSQVSFFPGTTWIYKASFPLTKPPPYNAVMGQTMKDPWPDSTALCSSNMRRTRCGHFEIDSFCSLQWAPIIVWMLAPGLDGGRLVAFSRASMYEIWSLWQRLTLSGFWHEGFHNEGHKGINNYSLTTNYAARLVLTKPIMHQELTGSHKSPEVPPRYLFITALSNVALSKWKHLINNAKVFWMNICVHLCVASNMFGGLQLVILTWLFFAHVYMEFLFVLMGEMLFNVNDVWGTHWRSWAITVPA